MTRRLAVLVVVVLLTGCGPAEPDRAVAASPTPSVSPSPTGPPAMIDRVAAAQTAITDALAAQSAALLRGDAAGYLALAEPGNAAVAAALRRRFGSLRAMKVAGYEQTIDVGPAIAIGAGGRDEWYAEIAVGTCFVDARCAPAAVVVQTRWWVGPEGARLVRVDPLETDDDGPLPWEVSELKVAVGRRVVVATTKRYASRLRSAVAAADRAAAVADRFALDGRPRYLVFLAGPKEFDTWYGGFSEWAYGFATSPAGSRVDVVIDLAKVEPAALEYVLRHELTHAATLGGDRPVHRRGSTWWVREGIADYAQQRGIGPSRYGADDEVRRYFRDEDWDGDLDTVVARDADPQWRVTAAYAISYLAVRRIADRFGEAKLIAFVDAVLREGNDVGTAASNELGVIWKPLRTDIRRYIRGMVGA